MHRRELNIFADFHQFYLQDEPASGDLSESWTDEAVNRLLATAPGTVGVGTVTNGHVRVLVEILPEAPIGGIDSFDQVNECSIEIAQGPLVVAGCTDYFPDAVRVAIVPGIYRVRVSYVLSGDESYLVQLWPAPHVEPLVLKARAA